LNQAASLPARGAPTWITMDERGDEQKMVRQGIHA
jgi:hypothetical protein